MEIRVTSQERVTLLTVEASRIDAASAIQFKDNVRMHIAQATGRTILDLSQVDFVDSSGLGAIVAVFKLSPTDAPLELAELRPDVDKVFRMTRMDSVFTIHSSLALALETAA